jgi:uncharacterized protein YgbK (DUF1537 family)
VSAPVFCAVADDDTGATDLAGMLAEQDLRTVLVIDGNPEKWRAGYDAVILGVGSRALPPAEAYARTREAVRKLKALAPLVIEIKYCSTFDSTPEGNIGPSIDAAMDETGETFTVALPALPVNGRTTYCGYHFVHGQLLSDSPMRDHPLTPMRNPNLVSHLQCQTRRRVGLAAYPVTRDKLDTLRNGGVEIAVLDCVSDPDLTCVCEAIAGLPLISGSSAPVMRLPAVWRRQGLWAPRAHASRRLANRGSGCLVVAGSCSTATRAQNQWLSAQGVETLVIDPLALLSDSPPPLPIPAGATCLVRTASEPADIERVHRWAAEKGWTTAQAGLKIAQSLAEMVRRHVERDPPAGLIVAGGETSTAICRALELGALEIGRNIDPGVPVCFPLGRFQAPVVLKSGNFGGLDFYARAIAKVKASGAVA